MNKEEFDKQIKRAFGGQGGLYFKNHYLETLNNKETLQQIAQDLQHDIKLELKDEPNSKNTQRYKKLLELKIDHDVDCYNFFFHYLENHESCYPELCGSIVGAMVKKEMYHSAAQLIGLDKLEENEELYWDS